MQSLEIFRVWKASVKPKRFLAVGVNNLNGFTWCFPTSTPSSFFFFYYSFTLACVWRRSSDIRWRRPRRRRPRGPVWKQPADEEREQPGSCDEGAGSGCQGPGSGQVTWPSSTRWFKHQCFSFFFFFKYIHSYFGTVCQSCRQQYYPNGIWYECKKIWSEPLIQDQFSQTQIHC